MIPPFFFVDSIVSKDSSQTLSEESSKHIVQVLRMKTGEQLRLTDGKGKIADAVITGDHKKKTEVLIKEVNLAPQPTPRNVIAISLLKNNTRLEWFLEKAAELGISKIIPLLCARTEKQHFRYERMKSILVSAMLQSQQSWLTELSEPISFKDFITQKITTHAVSKEDISGQQIPAHELSSKDIPGQQIPAHELSSKDISGQKISTHAVSTKDISSQKVSSQDLGVQSNLSGELPLHDITGQENSKVIQGFIAHCEDTHKEPLSSTKYQNIEQKLILIGPEGDFTPDEIKLAIDMGYHPVELGKTRLRTETAGVVAATLISINH